MIDNIGKQFRLQYKNFLVYVCIVLGASTFGNILHDLIVRFSTNEVETTFHLGTLIAIIAFLGVTFFGESQEMYMQSNFALGMGATRKSFYPSIIIVSLINYTLIAVEVWLLDILEGFKLKLFFPQYEVEALFGNSTSLVFATAFALSIVVASLGILFGTLMLRYGKSVFWVIWALWMAMCIGGPRVVEYVCETKPEMLDGVVRIIGTAPSLFMIAGASILAVVFAVIGWVSFRKQQVNL